MPQPDLVLAPASMAPVGARESDFNIDIAVGGEFSPDAACAFWRAFAAIAADLLDARDLVGEDHAAEEVHAA